MTAGNGEPASAWSRFFGWLISPSWTTLGAAALLVALYLSFGLGPRDGLYRLQKLATGGEVYWTESLFLYNQVSRMREVLQSGETRPVLAYVGGSTTQESIFSEIALERQILERTGFGVRAFDLSSAGQPLMTSWNLAELAACSGADLVVLGLNQLRLRNTGFNHPSEDVGYLGQQVARYIAEGKFEPRLASTLTQVLTSIRSQSGKLWVLGLSMLSGGITQEEVRFRETGRHRFLEGQRSRKTPSELDAEFAVFDQDARNPANRELLSRVVETVRGCGSRIVVFFSPVAPFDADRFPHMAAAQVELQSVAAASGLAPDEILDLQPVGWSAADFQDWGHFHNVQAIHRATSAIAAFAAVHLREGPQ